MTHPFLYSHWPLSVLLPQLLGLLLHLADNLLRCPAGKYFLHLNSLTEQLAAAHIQIKNLNQSVDSLSSVNKAVVKEKEAAQEESKHLTNEVNNLNTCYYVVGSKKELKANKIIETGFLRKTKILQGDYEMSYFTKADRRTLNEIPLHSKKAELMTNHPKGSYEIVDQGGSKVLHILSPDRFWEKSNFLVIKVD